MRMPMIMTTASVMRETIMTWRSVASRLMTPRKIFSATDEPVISRYDEADDMDAARMPDTTTPHINAGKIICAMTMKIFSAAAFVPK